MKNKRSNLRVISHIAVLMLVLVIAVVSTFSWYNRSTASQEGKLLKYSQSGNISGKGGTIQTFVGTNNNGVISYDTDISTMASVSTEPGAVNYFKTVITDETNSGDAVVSLYIENMKFSSMGNSTVKIGISQPEKTYKSYSGSYSGGKYNVDRICLIDNLYVKNQTVTEVYWFVEINKSFSGNGSIELGSLHLVYN